MINLVRPIPKTGKTGQNTRKLGPATLAPRFVGSLPTSLLLSSTEFTATMYGRKGGPAATARQVPSGGWVLAAGDTIAVLAAKRGGQRIFVTLEALVRAAGRLGVQMVFIEVPSSPRRRVDDEASAASQDFVTRAANEEGK